MQRLADNLKFRHKVMLVSIIVALFVGLVSIFRFQVSYRQYNEMLYHQTSSFLALLGKQIQFGMKTIEELSNMTTMDSSIQNDLYSLSQPVDSMSRYRARYDITQKLYQYLKPEIVCITILIDGESPIICGLDSSPEQQQVIDSIKNNSEIKNGAGFWITNDRNDGTILFAREIRKANEPDFLQSMGYLIFRVDFGKMVADSRSSVTINSEEMLLIADNKDNVFYSSIDPSTIDMNKFKIAGNKDYSIKRINGERLFVSYIELHTTDPALNIFTGLAYKNIFQSIIRTQVVTLVTIIVAIILAIVLADFAVSSINSRFELLVKKMNRFKSGNLDLLKSNIAYGNDELGLLNKHFDEVTIELKNIIEDNYIKELLITKAQLENLEQQIDPHFLYNTLEIINWLAKRNGETQIPMVVDALSKLLRSNLSEKEDVITLEKELSFLNSYITIQKFRYTDMLNFVFDIGPQTLGALIPKLSIQPLVENAISYSMEENIEGCRIIISSWMAGDEIIVSVENNGSQIDEDILDKLRNKVVYPNGNGIGLTNIDSRLKLIFGESYGLTFINGEDSVTVEIHIPCNPPCEEEEEYNV